MNEDLAGKASRAREAMQGSNPSVLTQKAPGERKRVPMTLPQLKLEVPDIPGYHLHWMRGTPQRLAAADRAGYEFVHPDEVEVNNLALGGDASKTGNTDMGSRVSIVEGSETDSGGQAVRLYLMKQKMEWYLADQKILQDRNDAIADTLTANYRSGQIGGRAEGERAEDVAARYVDPRRTKIPELFRRKVRNPT
jgi:hypothetical protein